jgi:molybdopterin converting factor small subunit
MKHLTIEYVAMLREHAGQREETISIAAETAAEVFADSCRRHGFSMPESSLRVAINDRIADWSEPVQSGDRLLFLPPASGG